MTYLIINVPLLLLSVVLLLTCLAPFLALGRNLDLWPRSENSPTRLFVKPELVKLRLGHVSNARRRRIQRVSIVDVQQGRGLCQSFGANLDSPE